MSDAGKVERPTQFEAKTLVQPNRGNVVTEHMEKRRFPPLLDFSTQDFYEPASKAFSPIVFIYANGADLNVSVDAHPFASHRN
jgi:hypothetical protein